MKGTGRVGRRSDAPHRVPLRSSVLAPNFERLMTLPGENKPWPTPMVLLDDALTFFWSALDELRGKEALLRAHVERRRLLHQGPQERDYPKRRSNTVPLNGTISAENDARLRASVGVGKTWPTAGELLDDALDLFWDLMQRMEEQRRIFLSILTADVRGTILAAKK